MSTREKIIIVLMVLAVGYGVYTVFLSGPQEEAAFKSNGDKELKALKLFIAKVADNTKNSLSKQQVYVLQKAQIEWKQDPLLQIKQKMSQEEKEELRPLVLENKILYTGFLQMGDKRLAILNGIEYEIGDRLESGDLIVRDIHPDHVAIGSPHIKSKQVILPMEEIE
jgi:flagellar basal body-associated protein FliL